jgi:hypothetical protein
MRKLIATLFATATIGATALAPAASAQPIITGGLVNITVTNLLNNNTVTVQVPIALALNLAANVCGVNVGVLAQQLRTGEATCTNATQTASALITGI